jgi:5-keto 4-deoxyuronate isomerase
MYTVSESDESGAAKVKIAVKEAESRANAESKADASTIWKYFHNSLVKNGQQIMDMAVPATLGLIKDF